MRSLEDMDIEQALDTGFYGANTPDLGKLQSKELVFVYGSLMEGFENHCYLTTKHSKFLGEAETCKRYRMIDLGSYPGLHKFSANTVKPNQTILQRKKEDKEYRFVRGELYEIERDIIKILDTLESNGSFYYREKTKLNLFNRSGTVEEKEAWMYILKYPHKYEKHLLVQRQSPSLFSWKDHAKNLKKA